MFRGNGLRRNSRKIRNGSLFRYFTAIFLQCGGAGSHSSRTISGDVAKLHLAHFARSRTIFPSVLAQKENHKQFVAYHDWKGLAATKFGNGWINLGAKRVTRTSRMRLANWANELLLMHRKVDAELVFIKTAQHGIRCVVCYVFRISNPGTIFASGLAASIFVFSTRSFLHFVMHEGVRTR